MPTIEIRSRAELACLVGAVSIEPAETIVAAIRAVGASEVAAVDRDHVVARVGDPVDALVAGLALAGMRDTHVTMIAASAAAADFVRADGGAPAVAALAWLVEAQRGDVTRTHLASPTGWIAVYQSRGMSSAPLPAEASAVLARPPAGGLAVVPLGTRETVPPLFVAAADEPVTFGRGAGCTLRVNASNISRKHLSLHRDPATGIWQARDLGSPGGYAVDGRRCGMHVSTRLVAGRSLLFALPVALAILAA